MGFTGTLPSSVGCGTAAPSLLQFSTYRIVPSKRIDQSSSIACDAPEAADMTRACVEAGRLGRRFYCSFTAWIVRY